MVTEVVGCANSSVSVVLCTDSLDRLCGKIYLLPGAFMLIPPQDMSANSITPKHGRMLSTKSVTVAIDYPTKESHLSTCE